MCLDERCNHVSNLNNEKNNHLKRGISLRRGQTTDTVQRYVVTPDDVVVMDFYAGHLEMSTTDVEMIAAHTNASYKDRSYNANCVQKRKRKHNARTLEVVVRGIRQGSCFS